MKEYILTKDEIKRYEDNAMNVLGLKQEVLMERAAVAVLNYVLEQFPVFYISSTLVIGSRGLIRIGLGIFPRQFHEW